MGHLILCTSGQAITPFYFKLTNTYLYTIEELCYYIYHNVTAFTSELRDEGLVRWIEEQLELKECADKLRRLISAKAGLKDIIVCILLSCDYYTQIQINELLVKVDDFNNLPPIELSIKRANYFLNLRQYGKAVAELEEIMLDIGFAGLEDEKKAMVLHNIGVALLHSKGPLFALAQFKIAYEKMNHKESLRSYFLLLLITRQEDKVKSEMNNYELDEDFLVELKEEYELSLANQKTREKVKTIGELKEAKESGKISKFYQDAYMLIEDLKKNYRIENG